MKKQKVVVISSYPSKEYIHDSYLGGVASYAKNTLLALKRIKESTQLDITVLADQVNQHTDYVQKNIRVKRFWHKNSLLIFPKLLRELFTHERNSKTVIIEFEHQMFGGPLALLGFPIFLLILKLAGKRVITVCHQVIPDMSEIGPHINVGAKSAKASLINLGLGIFYKSLLYASSKVIVFEENLKLRLAKYGHNKKIVVIPHGVQEFLAQPTKIYARKRLAIGQKKFVILLFGFLGWYKGTDWAIHAIKKIKEKASSKNIELIIAGGPNPNLEEKAHYIKYINSIKTVCEVEGIRLTGFVAEKDIPLYYASSDLVILPYRAFMSASGPLSLAISFQKPFLVSPKLKAVFKMKDMQEEMKKLKITDQHMHFKDFNGDFSKKIFKLEKDKALMRKISLFSRRIQTSRDWNTVGKQYYNEIIN